MYDEIRQAAETDRPGRRTEVTVVIRVLPLCAPHPYRSVRLHSRPHIDLQRVSAALCRH
ncbi:putative leader peptide [Streptomyces sp. IMTB 2501]|uniref:putative leader peptide n=1 Tax=Streptomyces sp. IMTB 2501 TaxID=1776340 RepID=UPI0026976C00